jgi:hypothetical protein
VGSAGLGLAALVVVPLGSVLTVPPFGPPEEDESGDNRQ